MLCSSSFTMGFALLYPSYVVVLIKNK